MFSFAKMMFPCFSSLLPQFVYSFFAEGDGEGGSDDSDETAPDGESGVAVTDDELDDEGWVAKRGAKNVREELKRKDKLIEDAKRDREELATLKAERKKAPDTTQSPAALPQMPEKLFKKIKETREFYEKYKNGIPEGKVAEYFEDMTEMVATVSGFAATSIIGDRFKDVNISRLSKAQKRELERDIDDVMSKFKDKHEFVLQKYAKEIKENIKKKYPVDSWDNEEVVEAEIGLMTARHISEISDEDTGREKKGKMNETENVSSSSSEGAPSGEFEEFCNERNFSTSTPAAKQAARNAYKAWKKVQNIRNE